MITLLWRMIFVLPLITIPAVQAADVVFNISGAIRNGACVVTSNNNQKIDLGMYSTNFLDSVGKITPLKSFEITLNNCPVNYSGIQVFFEGEPDVNNTNLISVQQDGAKNVGIALYEDDKITMIPVNSKSAAKTALMNQPTTLIFYAAYMSTGKVTDGSANADISFTVSYN